MKLRANKQPNELYKGGLYGYSRHANYLGEILFWIGSWLAGFPAITAAAVPFGSSTTSSHPRWRGPRGSTQRA